MSCPPLDEIVATCATAEALLAARVGGTLEPENERRLLEHLDSCAACMALARDLDVAEVQEALAGATAEKLLDLRVVATGDYIRATEIGRGGMGRVLRARDRRLGREVALKELLDDRLAAQFEREARLTARLQHPAIVSVHEAGRWPSGKPFYAMKYVQGKPLSEVIANAAALTDRLALLPSFITVAEAIAYAHSERVIHRDLKPHNILIGPFGETVVIDWGLAKDLGSREPDGAATPYREMPISLTRGGAGTPAYMAPEQALGESPDEGVDIYALGATLHHLLAGQPPGRADLPEESPAELRAIVHKAMMPARADRYESAAELVRELRRFQTGQLVRAHRYSPGALALRWMRRHRGGLLGVAATVAAIALFVGARHTVAAAPSCDAGEARLAGVWDPTIRSAVETKFLASGRPYAADTFGRVAASVDEYTAAWGAMHKEVCEATTVRHEQSEALLDLRMQCLERRLGELRGLTALFARAPDAELVDRAVIAVGKLDEIRSCADTETLEATVPLPADPTARVEIASLRGRLESVHGLGIAGKYRLARPLLAPVVADADRLGYPPLQLEAYVEKTTLEQATSSFKEGEAAVERWLDLAALLKNDRELARGWTMRIGLLVRAGQPDRALALVRPAELAVARAGDRALRPAFLRLVGEAYQDVAKYAEAERALREAVAIADAEPSVDDWQRGFFVNSLGNVLTEAGRTAEARAAYERAVDLWARRLGPENRFLAGALLNIGQLLGNEGKYEEHHALTGRALAIFEAADGPESEDVAIALVNLGFVDVALGRYDVAIERARRALAIREKLYGGDAATVSRPLIILGEALAHLGRADEAQADLARALAIGEKSDGPAHPRFADILHAAGWAAELRGDCAAALADEQRAVAIYEKALGKDATDLEPSLLTVGRCQLALGRAQAAFAPLQRAFAIYAARAGDPANLYEAAFVLGRARLELHRDDAAAPGLLIAARVGFAVIGPAGKNRLDEVNAELDRSRAATVSRAVRR